MKQALILVGIILIVVIGIKAQDTCPSPSGCVQITREAAIKAIEDGDARKALEKEVKTLTEAIQGKGGYRDQIADLRVEFAKVSGEYSGFKQGAVRVDAAFDTAIKNSKKRCSPFSLCLW